MFVEVVAPFPRDTIRDSTITVLGSCVRGKKILLCSPDSEPPSGGEE
jgi:hypothetical protein